MASLLLFPQTDPEYNFFACIKTSLARKVGCRPFWDDSSPPDIPACTTLEQLAKHQEIDQDIYLRYEQKIILSMTGCKVPCTYKVEVLPFSQISQKYKFF